MFWVLEKNREKGHFFVRIAAIMSWDIRDSRGVMDIARSLQRVEISEEIIY